MIRFYNFPLTLSKIGAIQLQTDFAIVFIGIVINVISS